MGDGRPGPAPQSEEREWFARLVVQGSSNAEACRIVGVNPRTGKRWRHGRTITSSSGRRLHYLPVVGARAREISPRYLSEDERVRIADLRRQGLGVRAVAAELGRSPATVSRELRSEFPDEPGRHLVHETIYQAVYRLELGGLRRDLPKVLHTGRRRRKPHRRLDARRADGLVGMTMIGQRPAEATSRCQPGHGEGGLITGSGNRSAIGTLAGRASRFTILLHLPGRRHTAEAVRGALVQAMGQLPAPLRRSLTWDQGKEMALHAEITQTLGMPVFFCGPRSPWQRPANENTNGLLRQYFPKGSDLRVHGPERLAAVAAELNDRPRKTLSWDTRLPASPPRSGTTATASEATARRRGCQDGLMASMRRRSPEPPPGPPQIQLKLGLAKEMLRELAPLLAEEGIDAGNIDVPDLQTLQQAVARAVERRNMALFTPVGQARELGAATLRLAVEATADGDASLAAAILDQAEPESADNSAPTVSGCLGIALGLLDDWLSGSDPHAPSSLGQGVRLPAGHWVGARAATDILVLARKGRAFSSLDTLIGRQGGKHVSTAAPSPSPPPPRPGLPRATRRSTTWSAPQSAERDYDPRTSVTVLRRWLESAPSGWGQTKPS